MKNNNYYFLYNRKAIQKKLIFANFVYFNYNIEYNFWIKKISKTPLQSCICLV